MGLVIVFGGLLAPTMELKLGVGGVSYAEFLQSMHLPTQLASQLAQVGYCDVTYAQQPIALVCVQAVQVDTRCVCVCVCCL